MLSTRTAPLQTPRVPPLPPLKTVSGQQMLAAAAKELAMEARDGIRASSRRAGSLTERGSQGLGLSLDLDGARRLSLSARGTRRSSEQGVQALWCHPQDIMASGPQSLTVAAARSRKKGIHAANHGPETKLDKELHWICEQIGLKAAQKFSTVREAFRYLDSDHDGKISRSEMQYFFRAYNFPSETADRFFDRLDHDASGEVDYAEFMARVAPYVQPQQVECCHSSSPECSSGTSTRTPSPSGSSSRNCALADWDLDSEIKATLEFIGKKAGEKFNHAREVFRCVDCDDDGTVTRKEMQYFCRVFNISEASADMLYDHFAGAASQLNYYDFVRILGPFLDLPGTVAMTQKPQVPRSGYLLKRPSLGCSSRDGSMFKALETSPLTKVHRLRKYASAGRPEIQELSPPDLEREMKEVMRDIGEKLPLKFRHVRDAFRPLDLSHNGKITPTEMRSFLRGFGWSRDVADRLFSVLDEEKCGEIDFNAFMNHFEIVLGPANRPATRAELVSVADRQLNEEVNQIASILGEKLLTKFNSARAALRTLDQSNDGKITLADMRLFFRTMCMPVDSANKMFKCLCKDGSESVEYEDFLALFGPVNKPGGRWRAVEELKGSASPSIWTIM